jgi:predicted PurR-regulated permease PerM
VAKGNSNRNWQETLTLMAGTVIAVVLITCLYWARMIFIPLALAVFLAFLLSPLVSFLQKYHIRRVPAVLSVVLLALLVLGGLVWLVTSQVSGLAQRLPEFAENIQAKVRMVTDRLESLNEYLNKMLGAVAGGAIGEATGPQQVVVKPESPWPSRLMIVAEPVIQGLTGGVLALVLTAFMLIKREDLRNRLIRLVGRGRITMATRLLDDAGQRISRFLVMQALIGAIAGVLIGLGLLAIGVEYALLWGFLVFLLRYVPYVGIWFAAGPPVLLSFAMSEGWTQPLMVVGLIFVVEMFCAYVLEPWLYGQSMGVSEVSLLLSAAFWAFLWGPIGMVLSSPLTVCLVVLGKYHPRMKFLDVLLGDEPALGPTVSFYQRLLARDQDEAFDIVLSRLQEMPPDKVLDELVVSALVLAKHDRERDDLPEDDEEFILDAAGEIGEELIDRMETPPSTEEEGRRAHVLGCPAHDLEDLVALRLLAAQLDPNRWEVEILSTNTLSSELVARTGEKQPDLICITALPPGGLAHTRYLCKRLRSRFPAVKIVVAQCGLESNGEEHAEQLRQAGADLITASLAETRAQMQSWNRALAERGAKAAQRREREPATQGT